jgi:hypothetical protein
MVGVHFTPHVQRKVVTPNDLRSLRELEASRIAVQGRYEQTADGAAAAEGRFSLSGGLSQRGAGKLSTGGDYKDAHGFTERASVEQTMKNDDTSYDRYRRDQAELSKVLEERRRSSEDAAARRENDPAGSDSSPGEQ